MGLTKHAIDVATIRKENIDIDFESAGYEKYAETYCGMTMMKLEDGTWLHVWTYDHGKAKDKVTDVAADHWTSNCQKCVAVKIKKLKIDHQEKLDIAAIGLDLL